MTDRIDTAALHDALGKLPAFTFADAGESAAPPIPTEPSRPIVVPGPPAPMPTLPHPNDPPMSEDQYLILAETALALRRRFYGAS